MKKISRLSIFLSFLICYFPAFAQWAVYDDKVYRQLLNINRVGEVSLTSSSAYQKAFKKLDELEDQAARPKGLDEDFSKLSEPGASGGLTSVEIDRYIGTAAGCGDKKGNPAHYGACMGLRNLRLQTLKQSQALLKNLADRRNQIVELLKKSRTDVGSSNEEYKAGVLARYQFELQGIQALMQADSLQLQMLMDGYRERAKLYEQQQMEARNSAMGSGASEKATNAKAPKFNLLP